jgi:hypothetical protein
MTALIFFITIAFLLSIACPGAWGGYLMLVHINQVT